MTLWLYLHFPRLQLDSLFAATDSTPRCIIDQHVIVQLNRAAMDKGIKPGMGLGSAAALCHQLEVHPYDSKTEKRRLKEIAHWLYILTSDISLFPPNGLLLRVSNMLTLYEGLQSYWHAMQKHLTPLNCDYLYATAYSPLAARLMAQSGQNLICDEQSRLSQRLCSHPVSSTNLGRKSIEKLNRVGIRHLGDLLELDIAEVAKRFDIDLVNYVGRLTGRFKHPVEFYYPPERFSRSLELLYELENIQQLEKPLERLFSQLESFLKLRDQVAYSLELILQLRDDAKQSIRFSSAAGDYLASNWIRLSQLSLESVKLDAPVQGITLLATDIRQQDPDHQDMFGGQRGEQSAPELISLLQAKLGSENVRGLTLTDDPRPELSTRLCEPMSSSDSIAQPSLLRPSFLLPAPKPLREKVSIMQGPERLATGWWDSGEILRDYFVARADSGRWLWVFRNREKEWFVHGYFS